MNVLNKKGGKLNEPLTPKSTNTALKQKTLSSMPDLSPLHMIDGSVSLFELLEDKSAPLKSTRTEFSNFKEDITKNNEKNNRLWLKGLESDFDEAYLEEKMQQLWKFTKWKMKKWTNKHKK